jgi:hypothetical protein
MDDGENMENCRYVTNEVTTGFINQMKDRNTSRKTWANMSVSGWYHMWYEKCHIIIYKVQFMYTRRHGNLYTINKHMEHDHITCINYENLHFTVWKLMLKCWDSWARSVNL